MSAFSLGRGEVLGFAGLIGAGRTEMAECVSGTAATEPPETYTSKEKRRGFRLRFDSLAYKLGYLSEDRKGKGLLMHFGIPENVSLISLSKSPGFSSTRRREQSRSDNYKSNNSTSRLHH